MYLEEYVTEHISKILSWSPESAHLFKISDVVQWCMAVPHCSSLRVNTLKYTVEDVVTFLRQKFEHEDIQLPEIKTHYRIPECIIIGKIKSRNLDLTSKENEVIVDSACGAAVLRGSHVFAPGILSITPKTPLGSKVSVYADLVGSCLKGYKQHYTSKGKLFLGNGIALQNRYHIFDKGKKPKGIAIQMTDSVSGIIMPEFPHYIGVLQNIPSMLCVRTFDPKPGETILDMCAAPGNKTTHIATLMNDEGTLIAIDKEPKIKQIKENCLKLNIRHCIHIFSGDSRQLVGDQSRLPTEGPPFSPESFDRILLDAACSGTGNRPMLKNQIFTEKTLKSFSKMQKSFITNAIPLLKHNGVLVYSTCSILCEENECVIAWLLEKYPEMQLVKADPVVGSSGLPNCGLNEEQRSLVQRFGPGTHTEDSIGFFIAKLKKKK